ncbi:MAG: CRISPR system precrRNA processing endoribonuclease RAMP protein Cas6 [Acidilobaceae archaeon]
MSSVSGRAYVIYANFRVLRSFPVISWSGSFVSSLIYSTSIRPLSVSPLYVDGRLLLSGRLIGNKVSSRIIIEGSSVSFRVSLLTEKSLDSILSEFRVLESRGLRLESLNFEEVRLPKDPLGLDGDRFNVTIEYAPTIFTFRSWRVLYPSPQRLIYSAALTASRLTNVDLRKTARKLLKHIELVGPPRTIVEEYSIGKKDSKERILKAFRGTATYGVYGVKNAEIFIALIKLAEKTNIGKSRGVGFGQIKLKSVTTLKDLKTYKSTQPV